MGPIAPKDPVKRRDFFYIMLEKQISAAPAPEGKGVCYIYEDGRLPSSAKIVGNITDEEELKLLTTAAGFRKLVYAIGVSVMTSEVPNCEFTFQMYGKRDTYSSGTIIKQTVSTDGVEYLIPLHEVEWSDDDDRPGQIVFGFDKPGFLSTVNVRFYLNDGYTAPPFEGLDPIDTTTDAYRGMIANSAISAGNNYRLKKVIERAQAGEDITLAYIGGSITQGAGATPINTECYTRKMFEAFESRYMKGGKGTYIKAGVGGTPSELGMIRYDRDVLADGKNTPDIVVIEFAVNDAGDETGGDCYEGLVRTALNGPGHPAVILLFAVFADDYNLEERLVPIGEHYKLPMVSLKAAVTKQFYLTKDTGRVLAKNRYFYDVFHPANIGHIIMADCLMQAVDNAAAAPFDEAMDYEEVSALRSADFEGIHLIDRAQNSFGAVIDCGDFTETDTVLQCCEMNLDAYTTPQFPNNWMRRSGDKPFVMDVNCARLVAVIKDSASPSDGSADFFVDGKLVKTINPHDVGWTHCNPQIIVREQTCGQHHIEVKMHPGDEDKCFTILGFGIVQ